MRRVLYSGFFDLLHAGHVRAFEEAKKLGHLIVHVASDKEAKAVKGALRPIIPGNERVEMVRALKCVDEVFYTPYFMTDEEVIQATKADIMIRNVGSEDTFSIEVAHIARQVPESGLDTTGIIRKIKNGQEAIPLKGVNYVLTRPDGKVLLQRRDNKEGIRCPGGLCLPGGALEKGENPLMAVAREFKEETGIDLHPDRFTFLTDFTYPWGETSRFYTASLWDNVDVESTEGKMEWHPISSYLELCGNQNQVLNIL